MADKLRTTEAETRSTHSNNSYNSEPKQRFKLNAWKRLSKIWLKTRQHLLMCRPKSNHNQSDKSHSDSFRNFMNTTHK